MTPVGIVRWGKSLVVLGDDGSVWALNKGDEEWRELPRVPNAVPRRRRSRPRRGRRDGDITSLNSENVETVRERDVHQG